MNQRGNSSCSVTPVPKPLQRLRDRRPVAVTGRRLSHFLPLEPAEQLLLDCCRTGEMARLAEQRPEAPDSTNRIRASFLRFLLLGGDEQAPVHERGVQLSGSWVVGQLDLEGCVVPSNVTLGNSHFDDLLLAQDARFGGVLALEGCCLNQGMNADRLQVSGGIYLRDRFLAKHHVRLFGAQIGNCLDCSCGQFEETDGAALSADGAVVKGAVFLSDNFRAVGEVRLLGAQIGGNLQCNGGKFQGTIGNALSADGMIVQGTVFLNERFSATGEVRLLGAQIGGDLQCNGGKFQVVAGNALSADRSVVKGTVFLGDGFRTTGLVRLPGAQIGGDLNCDGGRFEVTERTALSVDGAVVRGRLLLRDLQPAVRIGLSHAKVGVLTDDVGAWAPGSAIDGFCYGAFGDDAPTGSAERFKWLEKQPAEHLGKNFRPQPWRQLQRVLHEMGHHEDATQIGMAFENRLRAVGRVGQSAPTTHPIVAKAKRQVARGAHFCFGLLVGYGFRTMRLLAWMVGVWLVFGALFWFLALPPRSALAPSDPLVFQHPAYEECLPDRSPNPGNWFLCAPLRGEYATFSPFAFSLDILLPLVDLGQEKYWGAFVPTPKPGVTEEILNWSSGHVARLLIWLETLFGWVCSLLLVAIVSGLARRSEVD